MYLFLERGESIFPNSELILKDLSSIKESDLYALNLNKSDLEYLETDYLNLIPEKNRHVF